MVEAAMKQVQQSTRIEKGSPKRSPPKSINRLESPKRVLCDVNNKNNSNAIKMQQTAKLDKLAKYKFVVVLSQVERQHYKAVDKLCARENGFKTNSLIAGCTHVITKTTMEGETGRNCSRTLKTLQGMF